MSMSMSMTRTNAMDKQCKPGVVRAQWSNVCYFISLSQLPCSRPRQKERKKNIHFFYNHRWYLPAEWENKHGASCPKGSQERMSRPSLNKHHWSYTIVFLSLCRSKGRYQKKTAQRCDRRDCALANTIKLASPCRALADIHIRIYFRVLFWPCPLFLLGHLLPHPFQEGIHQGTSYSLGNPFSAIGPMSSCYQDLQLSFESSMLHPNTQPRHINVSVWGLVTRNT